METFRIKLVTGFALVVFFLSMVNAGAENIKIGIIDAQRILDKTKAGKKAKATMEEFVKSRQKIIDLEEQDIKSLEDELVKQGPVLSTEAKKDKQETFQRKMLDYQNKVSDLNKEVQRKKKEVLEGFNKTLEEIVKNIAEKESYTIILDRNSEGGALIYAKDSLDLTDKVVQEFDKRTPSTTTTLP